MNNYCGSTNVYLHRWLCLFALSLTTSPGFSTVHTPPIMHCVPPALYLHTAVFIVHYKETHSLRPVSLHTLPLPACRTPEPPVAQCLLLLICCSLHHPAVSSSSCVFWHVIVRPRHNAFLTRDWAHKLRSARPFLSCALPIVNHRVHRPYDKRRAFLSFRAFILPLSPRSTPPLYTFFYPDTCDASLKHVARHTQSMHTLPPHVCAGCTAIGSRHGNEVERYVRLSLPSETRIETVLWRHMKGLPLYLGFVPSNGSRRCSTTVAYWRCPVVSWKKYRVCRLPFVLN